MSLVMLILGVAAVILAVFSGVVLSWRRGAQTQPSGLVLAQREIRAREDAAIRSMMREVEALDFSGDSRRGGPGQ